MNVSITIPENILEGLQHAAAGKELELVDFVNCLFLGRLAGDMAFLLAFGMPPPNQEIDFKVGTELPLEQRLPALINAYLAFMPVLGPDGEESVH